MAYKHDPGSNVLVKKAGAPRRRPLVNKYCTKCQKETEFYKTKRSKGRRGTGPDYRCRICTLEYSRIKIRRNKTNWVKWKGGKCVHCGLIDDVCIYDFHHIDPSAKEFGMFTKITLNHSPLVENELTKCVLLCCLCHRKVENGIICLTKEEITNGLRLNIH